MKRYILFLLILIFIKKSDAKPGIRKVKKVPQNTPTNKDNLMSHNNVHNVNNINDDNNDNANGIKITPALADYIKKQLEKKPIIEEKNIILLTGDTSGTMKKKRLMPTRDTNNIPVISSGLIGSSKPSKISTDYGSSRFSPSTTPSSDSCSKPNEATGITAAAIDKNRDSKIENENEDEEFDVDSEVENSEEIITDSTFPVPIPATLIPKPPVIGDSVIDDSVIDDSEGTHVDDSAELPAVKITELPAVKSTELPAVKSTELPAVKNTELPAVKITELPVDGSSESSAELSEDEIIDTLTRIDEETIEPTSSSARSDECSDPPLTTSGITSEPPDKSTVPVKIGITTGQTFDYNRHVSDDIHEVVDEGYDVHVYGDEDVVGETTDHGNIVDADADADQGTDESTTLPSATTIDGPGPNDQTPAPPKPVPTPDPTDNNLPSAKITEIKADDKSAAAINLKDMDIIPNLQATDLIPSISSLISDSPAATEEEEIEDMKHVLATLQKVLLYMAGVTSLAILLYSVYYINLIRRIYAKKKRKSSESEDVNSL